MASNNASLTKTLLWTVPVALLLGLVLIAVNAANPTPSTTVPAGVAEVFEDFQCPHCRDLALNVEPTIIKEYVQTGKVKLVYRHFIVIGPDSAVAGQAAECAAKQNQFWPYHDKLFSAQGVRTAYTADSLKKYAVDLGLNASAFNTCLDTGETQRPDGGRHPRDRRLPQDHQRRPAVSPATPLRSPIPLEGGLGWG